MTCTKKYNNRNSNNHNIKNNQNNNNNRNKYLKTLIVIIPRSIVKIDRINSKRKYHEIIKKLMIISKEDYLLNNLHSRLKK